MSKFELNEVRAAVWWCVLKHEAKTEIPDRIQEAIASHFSPDLNGSRNLAAFAAGRRLPFRHQQLPLPRDAIWPRRAAKLWPATGEWFFTPFWFLVNDQKPVTLELIGKCIQLLAFDHQEYLYAGVPGGVEEALNFLPIDQSHVCALSVPANPGALGALACAMRRATISGEGHVARWCGVGIVWLLLHLCERHEFLAAHLEHLANFVLMQLSDVDYPPGFHWPVEVADLVQFEWERTQYLERGLLGLMDVVDARRSASNR